MKTIVTSTLLTLLAAGVIRADTIARADFSRYAVILDRKPFGEVVRPKVEPVAEPAKELAPDSPLRALELVAITETDSGIRVGLINGKISPPKQYFLYVGQSEDGFDLVEADYEGERALVASGEDKAWLSMGGGGGGAGSSSRGGGNYSGPGPISTSMASGYAQPERGPAAGVGAPIAPLPTVPHGIIRRSSYAERLRLRREAEAERLRRIAERPAMTPQQVEESLKAVQMDSIRNGDPPLPIPLTPEMDEQLVREGVLPPAEP